MDCELRLLVKLFDGLSESKSELGAFVPRAWTSPREAIMHYGTELMRQAEALALFSEDAPKFTRKITRTYLSGPFHCADCAACR